MEHIMVNLYITKNMVKANIYTKTSTNIKVSIETV